MGTNVDVGQKIVSVVNVVVVVSGDEVVVVVVIVVVVVLVVVVVGSSEVVVGGTKVVDEMVDRIFKVVVWSSGRSPLESILLVLCLSKPAINNFKAFGSKFCLLSLEVNCLRFEIVNFFNIRFFDFIAREV